MRHTTALHTPITSDGAPLARPARPASVATLAVAGTLAALALLVPPASTAAALAGPSASAERLATVTAGMWVWKAMLAIHAGLLLAATRVPLRSAARIPLLSAAATQARVWSGEPLILAALLALGAAARLHNLGAGLWYDEITALVRYARVPAGQIVTSFDSQNQHMLYSLAAHSAIVWFGDGAWALRLPAALFGVASLWAAFSFGVLVTARREALLATAILAASYHHVWFSQNARGYSALLFFTLLSSAFFIRLLRQDHARGWRLALGYAVLSALGVYTHTSAVFVVAAHFAIWAWLAARAARARGWGDIGAAAWMPLAGFVLAGTLTLQLYAPVLPQLLTTVTAPTMAGVAVEWKNPLWFAAETVRGLGQGVPGGAGVLVAALLGATAVGAAGVWSFWRRSPAVAAIMLLPAVVTAAGMLATAHNLWPRFFFFCAGFAVLIAVRGIFMLASLTRSARAPAFATAATVLLAAASAATLPRAWRPKQDFAAAREYLERTRAANDAVVMVDLTRFPYQRYLGTGRGWMEVTESADLARVEASHRRTWVVYTFPARLSATSPELWRRIQRTYTRAATFPGTVGGGAVVVMVRG